VKYLHDQLPLLCFFSSGGLQDKIRRMKTILYLLFLCLSFNTTAHATSQNCMDISNNLDRLDCYDQLAQVSQAPSDTSESLAENYINQAWELSSEYNKPTFSFRAHHLNYLLPLRYTSHTNPTPQSPSHANTTSQPTQAQEVRFQLSFKTKLKNDMLGSHASTWFAFTQQSNWQFYNTAQSAPFRETNYQPELILSIPTPWSFGDFRVPLVNLALNHQSNGQAGAYSRSWNRVYIETSITQGSFLTDLRLWARLPEAANNDDNPNILQYMGHGEWGLTWFQYHSEISIHSRYSFSGRKGMVRIHYSFPINGHLKGYAEFFNGYGETLIDYNHYQSVGSIGFLLSTWD